MPRARDSVVVVDSRHRNRRSLSQVEHAERRPTEGAARHGLVPGEPGARVLEVHFVLVRPEPRRLRKRRSGAGHRPTGGEALALGGLKMLDPYPLLIERAPELRHIASCEDVGGGGTSELVDQDAAVDRDAGLGGKLRPWRRAHADHDWHGEIWWGRHLRS